MNKKGFSLLELLVVVTIIMVLTAAGVASYANATKRSRDARRMSDIEQYRQALEMYRSDNGTYPAAANSLVPNYIATLPLDPKFNGAQQYNYRVANANYGYCVCAVVENTTGVNNCAAAPISLAIPAGWVAATSYCMRSP